MSLLALVRTTEHRWRGHLRAQQGHTKNKRLSSDLVAKAVTGTTTECQFSSAPASLSRYPRIPTAPSTVVYRYYNLVIPYLMSLRLLPASPGFFTLFPTAQPEWLKVISDTEADIGSNLRWACAAAGKPRPMVRWLRNGEPLASQVGNQGSLPRDLLIWSSYSAGQTRRSWDVLLLPLMPESHGHRWVSYAVSQSSDLQEA